MRPCIIFLSIIAANLFCSCLSAHRENPTATTKAMSPATSPSAHAISLNAMAPLLIGDPSDMNAPNSKTAWESFDKDLVIMKDLGIDAISTDVWWGIVESTDEMFNWAYYDAMVAHITAAGLRWVPILSLHQCGGNVGDDCNIPVPNWVWAKYASCVPSRNSAELQYKSEQGNYSREFISAWATPCVMAEYRSFMTAFQNHFAKNIANISEVNLSLGPAGELRYPSYNSHDKDSGYPTRGALQAYSELAKQSFSAFAIKKYGSLAKANKAWGAVVTKENGGNVLPPANPKEFFEQKRHLTTQYGKDFFDWYGDSLFLHGKQMLGTAIEIFSNNTAPFKKVAIGAKVPGIHWRMGHFEGNKLILADRLAELAAGLIRTSNTIEWQDDAKGHGYRPIISIFSQLKTKFPAADLTLHFTCLEMADGQDKPEVQSLAHSLVKWVGLEAHRQQLNLKGENALGGNIPNKDAWDLMASSLELPGNTDAYYKGLTFLRMTDIAQSPVAQTELKALHERINH